MISPKIYGIHDPGNWFNTPGLDSGWCVYTEAVGSDPNNHSGKDYRHEKITPIVRLNNAYGQGHGTIPTPDRYRDFAQRCANFVAASQGIEYVVVSNEISLMWEWPTDQPLTLAAYLDCYRLVYDAIKNVAPHVQIAPAAVAPWNDQCPDAKDWIDQLGAMLTALGDKVDWICLHAYTRGYSLDSFQTGARMGAPYQHRYSSWETLREFLHAIPSGMQRLPIMITEVNGNEPWSNHNTGWIAAMYDEVYDLIKQGWNIRAACLFRWLPDDKQWTLANSPGVADDWRNAVSAGYTWTAPPAIMPMPTTNINAGDTVQVIVNALNVRNAPSLQGEVALKYSNGTTFEVDEVYTADGLIWLKNKHGWCAEFAPNGSRLIQKVTEQPDLIKRLSAQYGIDERLLRAVVAVESGGSGFRDGRLLIRFEPHVFIGMLPDDKKEAARNLFTTGSPAWDGNQHRMNGQPFHGNQLREWAALAEACKIDRHAAIQSISMGAPQIMGFHYAKLGYGSPDAMLLDFAKSQDNQIVAMFKFLEHSGALAHLQQGNLDGFITIYNGSGQVAHYRKLINGQLGVD